MYMIFFKTQITKVLIRLCGWAGWSAPVLFANLQRQVFSRQGPFVMIFITSMGYLLFCLIICHIIEPKHEISNNVVCATSKGSDQPALMRSLIRAFASRLNIL